jgi:hypothetical protein
LRAELFKRSFAEITLLMKYLLLLLFSGSVLTGSLTAQINYETVLTLQPGERVEKYLSCWWPSGKNEIASLVIRQADGKLTAIENGRTRKNLSQDDLLANADCARRNPYAIPRESHVKFSSLQSNGQWRIRSAAKDYGTYGRIMFMRENERHFIAVVASGTEGAEQYYYLDDSGKKELLGGRPRELFTNSELTRGGVMLSDKGDASASAINKLPRAQQVALLEQMSKSTVKKQVWLSDGKTLPVDKKSRLFFDASGRHFIEASPLGVFYVDGVPNKRNVSGGGTVVFVSESGDNWAHFYEIYLAFKDGTSITGAISPYLVKEDGSVVVVWYEVKEENGVTVVRRGSKRL